MSEHNVFRRTYRCPACKNAVYTEEKIVGLYADGTHRGVNYRAAAMRDKHTWEESLDDGATWTAIPVRKYKLSNNAKARMRVGETIQHGTVLIRRRTHDPDRTTE